MSEALVRRTYDLPKKLDKQIARKAKLLGITKNAVVWFALERFVYDLDQLQKLSWDEVYRLMDERKGPVDEEELDDPNVYDRLLAREYVDES